MEGRAFGEAPGSVRKQRERVKLDKSLYCGFFRKQQVRQGEQT